MYDQLTFRELSVLQKMLFAGTEESFRVANMPGADSRWFSYYRPTHSELVQVFVQVGTELLHRIESRDLARLAA